MRAARAAFDRGPWPRLTVDDRKDILYRIRDLLRTADELAYLESLNAGLPIGSVREQIGRAARNFEFFAEVASTVAGQTYTGDEGYLTYVTREPKGVGALIAPWNAPLALGSMRVATCIAFGNTCVLKPSDTRRCRCCAWSSSFTRPACRLASSIWSTGAARSPAQRSWRTLNRHGRLHRGHAHRRGDHGGGRARS